MKNYEKLWKIIEISRNNDYTAGNLLVKNIINSLLLICQDKQIQVFLYKLGL